MSRTDKGSRLIAASPEKVNAAFVDADALTVWLPPAAMSGVFERFDPRPGGSYRMVLTYDDAPASGGKVTADSDIVEARLVDITADDVFDAVSPEDHAAGMNSSLVNLAGYLQG